MKNKFKNHPSFAEREVLDAAYWVKGCSSLGRLRFAVLLGIGKRLNDDGALCLMDIKEAVPAIAPCYGNLPQDHAVRVVTGARHLSPALGERMIAARLLDKPVFLRELLPQDLKLEIPQLKREEAMKAARCRFRGCRPVIPRLCRPVFRHDVAWLNGVLLAVGFCRVAGCWSILYG